MMIATLLSGFWVRVKFLLLAFAILFYGLLLPGVWIAGVPLGVGLSVLLMRHVAAHTETPSLPPTMVSAAACYAFSLVPAYLALFCGAQIASAAKHGPAYEVTIAGVALGFFLHPTYKLVRWGRGFHLRARQPV